MISNGTVYYVKTSFSQVVSRFTMLHGMARHFSHGKSQVVVAQDTFDTITVQLRCQLLWWYLGSEHG